jgi:hypothetical protein
MNVRKCCKYCTAELSKKNTFLVQRLPDLKEVCEQSIFLLSAEMHFETPIVRQTIMRTIFIRAILYAIQDELKNSNLNAFKLHDLYVQRTDSHSPIAKGTHEHVPSSEKRRKCESPLPVSVCFCLFFLSFCYE